MICLMQLVTCSSAKHVGPLLSTGQAGQRVSGVGDRTMSLYLGEASVLEAGVGVVEQGDKAHGQVDAGHCRDDAAVHGVHLHRGDMISGASHVCHVKCD